MFIVEVIKDKKRVEIEVLKEKKKVETKIIKEKKRVKVEVLVQKKLNNKVIKNIKIVLKKIQISKYKVSLLASIPLFKKKITKDEK